MRVVVEEGEGGVVARAGQRYFVKDGGEFALEGVVAVRGEVFEKVSRRAGEAVVVRVRVGEAVRAEENEDRTLFNPGVEGDFGVPPGFRRAQAGGLIADESFIVRDGREGFVEGVEREECAVAQFVVERVSWGDRAGEQRRPVRSQRVAKEAL